MSLSLRSKPSAALPGDSVTNHKTRALALCLFYAQMRDERLATLGAFPALPGGGVTTKDALCARYFSAKYVTFASKDAIFA